MPEQDFSPIRIMSVEKTALEDKIQKKRGQLTMIREALQEEQNTPLYKAAVYDITEGILSVQPTSCNDANEGVFFAIEKALTEKQKTPDYWISRKAGALSEKFWGGLKNSKCGIKTEPEEDRIIIDALKNTLFEQDSVNDFIRRIEDEPFVDFFKAPCKKTAVSRFLYEADSILTTFEKQELPGVMNSVRQLAEQKIALLEEMKKEQRQFTSDMRDFLKANPPNKGSGFRLQA